MRPKPVILLLTVLSCTCLSLYSQDQIRGGKVTAVRLPYYAPVPSSTSFADSSHSGTDTQKHSQLLLPITRQAGKKGFSSFALPADGKTISGGGKNGNEGASSSKAPLLQIHGNILYNVDYRSYIDTPYAENDVYYHTIQTYLDVTYKNSYPMRVYLTNRFGNSAFTRRFTDLNMQFNANDFKNRIRQTIQNYPTPHLPGDSLHYHELAFQNKFIELEKLKAWLNSSFVIQKLVEEKEKVLYPGKDTLLSVDTGLDRHALQVNLQYKITRPGFTVPDYLKDLVKMPEKPMGEEREKYLRLPDSAFLKRYENGRKQVDSLAKELAVLEKKYLRARQQAAEKKDKQKTGLYQAASLEELQGEMAERGVPDSALPAGYKTLWAIKSLGIGRTMVDYSELSAKNVSINGVQVEYNPSYYVAFAAGTINYRFRDFLVKNANTGGQHLYLVRVGRGEKNGNNIILTWYTGKKQLYNSNGNSQAAQPDFHLMGFTLEGNYRLGPATLLTAEVAKSSLPYYTNAERKHTLLSDAVRFNEHSNEAYSLKVQTAVKATDTRIQAFYKHYGANFQSYSLITTGMQQRAWLLKADQPFFRKQLMVTGSLKENDYTNPAANVSYQSNIVFKSIQATLRIPKWPVFTAGYYPSAQLTKLADNAYTENMFYSLVANMSYYYKVNSVNMSSTAMYTRFYNKQSDSAFIYANTTNLLVNQAFFYDRLTCQTTGSAALGQGYNLYTVDNEVQYALFSWLSAGAGIKYNRQTYYNITQMGYRGNVVIRIKKLGEFQLMADKGFIPGANRQLVENTTGRFSYFKIF